MTTPPRERTVPLDEYEMGRIEQTIRADEREFIVKALRQRDKAGERSTWAQAADFIERMGEADDA